MPSDSAPGGPSQASLPLVQEAYVWQRAWTEPVRAAVRHHSADFNRIVALDAEVSWRGVRPALTRMAVDWESLRGARCGVGLAMRIGSYTGPFAPNGEPLDSLVELAAGLVREAEREHVRVTELQIDFDCAESKLAGYQVWVSALRRRISPMPLIITTLPSWLRRPEFESLARTTDGYVLQVHSLERPASAQASLSLCDPQIARRAVERAGQIGVPFRVALPTYGYVLGFDAKGAFVGLSAEGPARSWPPGTQIKELRSDAVAMADLVREWMRTHPAHCQGVIWYRLPTGADERNWRWPTLAAVMHGRRPQARLISQLTTNESGTLDVSLSNDGDLDAVLPASIVVRWDDGALVASDALAGFDLVEGADRKSIRFQPERRQTRLAAGGRRPVGWLRLESKSVVKVDLRPSENEASRQGDDEANCE